LPVERALRQEAGYGCCQCGHPIFQYHHIVPYTSDDPHYRIADMMILCPNCHDEATRGVMTPENQRKLKAEPFNIRMGFAKGQLFVPGRETRVLIGDSLAMVAQGSLLEIDGDTLLGLSVGPAGDLRISVALYSESDTLLARIVDNVWETGDDMPWDLDADYGRLTIRNGLRDIALELDARSETPVIRGRLWRKGYGITLDDSGITTDEGGGIGNLTIDGGAVRFDSQRKILEIGTPRRMPVQTVKLPGRNDPCWCGSGQKFKKCHG
jgi:hypothetical protein